ncbi:hypothetical protein ACJ6WF_37675 [Streptomyces sp. MMS24-I2-30]|uniref:hypothetical protein n=1 Tax=Streptomyces sp. MMS24-I2-30 TaxID=3351564 RepID=UPI003896E4A3
MEGRGEVAAWCEALPLLRRIAAAQGRADEVAELVRRLRTDRGVVPQLDELGRQFGIPGVGPRSVAGVPGVAPGVPVDGLFVCPADRCDRDWVRAPGVATPECHLFEEPLARTTPERRTR